MPVVVERPAKQCPPLRAATGSRSRRAKASASATSSADRQRATTCGRTSWKRAIAGRRASSYPSESGVSASYTREDHNPVGLPGPPTVEREGLLPAGRGGRDLRPVEAHADRDALE